MSRPKSTDPVNAGVGGRKPLPEDQKRKRRIVWLTDAEWEKLQRPLAAIVEARRKSA